MAHPLHCCGDVLRIQRSAIPEGLQFSLSGRISAEDLPGLTALLAAETGTRCVLDLDEVDLIDRETVQFLMRCEDRGIDLRHCPGYVREWIKNERKYL